MQSLTTKLNKLTSRQKILLLGGGLIFLCVCLCCPAGFFFQPDSDTELTGLFPETDLELESIPEVAAPAAPPTLAPPSKLDISNLSVEYILDASALMNKTLADGRSRIEVAADQISANLTGHHPATNLGLRIFGHRHAREDTAGSCQDTELVIPIDRSNHETVADWLQELPPAQGLTPLTTALEEASHDFNPEPDRVKAIILVSGSGETCQRDPCALVNQWQIEGLVITVYAIGLNVEEGARQQLQCVAEAGGGAYYDAATATDVAHALTQIQQTLKQEEVVIPAAVAMMPTPTATPLPTATATRVVVFHTPASISETTDTAPSPESPPAEKTATPPPLQGRIAFSTMRADLKNEIFVMSAGGQNPTRVTRFAASAVFPAWSPDGWWLAFASNHEGDYDIYVNNVSGNSLTRLTNTPGEDNKPAWSPDGARLVFASARNDAGCDVDCKFELYLMDADGSQQANLTNHPANDDSPDWSPDGQQILFSSDRDGNDEIYTWDLREQVLTRLTNHPERDTSPVWSPDGRRIAFESYRDGNFEIYVMDADGTNPRRLTKNAIWDAWPAWSPDGARLVFASQRDGADFDLYTITAEGGHEIRLTDDPTVDLHPSWAAR